MKVRDSQRQKLYDAERLAFDNNPAIPDTMIRYESVEDCEKAIRLIWSKTRFQNEFPAVAKHWRYQNAPRVKPGFGCRRATAYCGRWSVTLPVWSRKRWVIVHELAHLAHYAEGSAGQADHGWQYALTYLRLTRLTMGVDAYEALRQAFKAKGVRYKAPRAKKPMSDEAKAALAERLKAARAARKKD
jgi:putative metallohydrolase (TIGR04338 family)